MPENDEYELTLDECLSQVILRMYHGELLSKDDPSYPDAVARIRFDNPHSATGWATTSNLDGRFEDISYVSQPCTLVVKIH
jgi:hypothetical protein